MGDESAGKQSAVASTLGPPGRLIGPSKTTYRERHPDHLVIFNANVCLDREKVWHGDIDLTDGGEEELLALARATGQTVHLLYEMDARFQHEARPLTDRCVYSATPSGHNLFDHVNAERRQDGVLYQRASGQHASCCCPGVDPAETDPAARADDRSAGGGCGHARRHEPDRLHQ